MSIFLYRFPSKFCLVLPELFIVFKNCRYVNTAVSQLRQPFAGRQCLFRTNPAILLCGSVIRVVITVVS